jgi:hypothetical protein
LPLFAEYRIYRDAIERQQRMTGKVPQECEANMEIRILVEGGQVHFLGRDDAFQACPRDSTDTTQTIVEAKMRRLAAVRRAHRPRRTRPGLP